MQRSYLQTVSNVAKSSMYVLFVDGKLPLCSHKGLEVWALPNPIKNGVIAIGKNCEIKFRVTKENLETIRQNANTANRTLTAFLTERGLDDKSLIVLEDLRPVCHELRKIGTNLNQLTMLAHQGRISCVDLTAFSEAVKGLWQPLNLLTEKTRHIKR